MNKTDSIPQALTALLLTITLCGGAWAAAAPTGEAETAAAEPAAAEPAAEETATAEQTTPVTRRHGYRSYQDRRIARSKAVAEARRNAMEHWRSQRRWWNNPGAENRRQWNKARNRWYRDMAEARSSYNEQFRPQYRYGRGYNYRRNYP